MNGDNTDHAVERYAYCLCLHVRPGTIFVAIVNLGGSLICAIVTLALLSYSDASTITWDNPTDTQKSTRITLAIIIYMMLASVSAMLLYGVLKSRATYILPFFGIQFIDFLFTLPQFLTSLYSHHGTYNYDKTNVHSSSGGLFDVRHVWPNAAPANPYTSSLFFTTLIVLFKCYFLCVVWKCYRYLRMREMILPLHLPYHTANSNDGLMIPPLMVPPPNIAPPAYDEATKSCAPPDYETATKNDGFKYVPVTPPQQTQQQQQTQSEESQPKDEQSHEQSQNDKSVETVDPK